MSANQGGNTKHIALVLEIFKEEGFFVCKIVLIIGVDRINMTERYGCKI